MRFEIKGVRKQYGKKMPLSDGSFTVESGECVGILGRNGSGKSTLLSVLAGVQKADSGAFLADDSDLFRDSKLLSSLVGYVPQGTPLIEELSAKDNLLLWCDKKTCEQELKNGVLKMLGIGEFIGLPVRKMSGGMKKRLSIGCSVVKKPELLLLDEPCAALDLMAKANIRDYLAAFKKGGGAIVLTTHDADAIALCDRLYILKDGALTPYRYDGDIAGLTRLL